MDRRQVLKGGAGSLALAMAGAVGFRFGDAASGSPFPLVEAYGPLRRADDSLAVPPGFEIRLISEEGSTMSDGRPTPPLPDGMATFELENGNLRLLRNHEILNSPIDGFEHPPGMAYDVKAWGGVTALEVDPLTREVISEQLLLSGTMKNCNGGATPWGSWLSCEEWMFGPAGDLDQPHGYVFEVPATAQEPVDPVPLRNLGRFFHEAVAVCPEHGVVYETEDFDVAPFYRWVPDAVPASDGRLDLQGPGTLQALIVPAEPGINLSATTDVGASWITSWVDIDDPDPPFDLSFEEAKASDLVPPVGAQAFEAGAAVFRRLEGCQTEDGIVWFTSTDGGHGSGQVWRYEPTDRSSGRLSLIFASPSKSVLSGPDSLCLSPQGSIVVCEDSSREPNRVVAITSTGLVVPLAANIGDDEEFAGACFSPDGNTLFVNIMGDRDDGLTGRTYAIWGPWQLGPV